MVPEINTFKELHSSGLQMRKEKMTCIKNDRGDDGKVLDACTIPFNNPLLPSIPMTSPKTISATALVGDDETAESERSV